MKKLERNEYYFFYTYGSIDPYAYSNDVKIIKKFYATRNMKKFIIRRKTLSEQDLSDLNDEEPGGLLMPYQFKITDTMNLMIPITLNEKMTIESIGNQISLLYIHLYASVPISIFNKDTRNALHLMEYDKTSQQNKDGNYHEFIPNFLIIFYKEFGDLMKGSD